MSRFRSSYSWPEWRFSALRRSCSMCNKIVSWADDGLHTQLHSCRLRSIILILYRPNAQYWRNLLAFSSKMSSGDSSRQAPVVNELNLPNFYLQSLYKWMFWIKEFFVWSSVNVFWTSVELAKKPSVFFSSLGFSSTTSSCSKMPMIDSRGAPGFRMLTDFWWMLCRWEDTDEGKECMSSCLVAS